MKIELHGGASVLAIRVPEGRPTIQRFSRPCGTGLISILFPAFKRRAILRKSLQDSALLAALVLFLAAGARAETTNDLSEAEIQGRKLSQQIISAKPETNLALNGLMKIKNGKGINYQYYFQSVILTNTDLGASRTGWRSAYYFGKTNNFYNGPFTILPQSDNPLGFKYLVLISHFDSVDCPLEYASFEMQITGSGCGNVVVSTNIDSCLSVYKESDFSTGDLALEFFHWPAQKVLPKTTNLKRGRAYTLLESTNPNPPTNGYSSVLSWIDQESGGILQAEAYDANGKLLKVFEPKTFKKINGQWELQEMEIRNVQTGSRTRLEFDLKKSGE